MIRTNVYLTQEQHDTLNNLHNRSEHLSKLPISEHIRRAIDEYLERRTRNRVSISPSKNT